MRRPPFSNAALVLLLVVSQAACERAPYAFERSWPIMGTTVHVRVTAADSATAHKAVQAGSDEISLVDNLMSTYQGNSEISVLNRRAGTDSITYVSPSTTSVLAAAVKYAKDTDGALDISIGPLLGVWGFRGKDGRVPTAMQIDSARRLTGLQRIVFNESERTVRLPQRGMQLDLGALAQGFALERGARAMRSAGALTGRVELGGNVVVFGTPPEQKWPIPIADPRDTARVVATIALDSGSVSTSSTSARSFEQGGVRYSHIIDPRTAQPLQSRASVTVIGGSGMASDALATALLVLGAERGCAVAAKAGVQAVWVTAAADSVQVTATPGLETMLRAADSRPFARCP
jgi:FAD:protein FMN transferase